MKHDNKLEKMKQAMQFLIKKLGWNHRLSVVTFSTRITILCPLRRMTPEAQKEVGKWVDDLTVIPGSTNIACALRTASSILNERTQTSGRVPAIMLMSDGDQDPKLEDARKVGVNNLPVFTFGFGHGKDYDPQVLNKIANNSKGGTFSVANLDSIESAESANYLNLAFARCLGGLLTVVAQNLKLTITRPKPNTIKINNVSADKSYPVNKKTNDSRTISFGHLYHGEKRKVLVDLHLPVAPKNNDGYEVLQISYSFEYQGELVESSPVTVSVYRTNGVVDDENIKVATEQNRVAVVGQMQKATDLTDDNNFSEAQNQLKEAQDLLQKAALNQKVLKSQVSQFIDLMKDPKSYKEKGKHIALAILTSHYRQREAATSDDPNAPSLFTTPGALALVKQATKYAADPTKPLQPFKPNVIEFKPSPPPEPTLTERVSDNIGKAIGALKTLVASLQEIQNALNSTTNA